jgi:hypothetical protein
MARAPQFHDVGETSIDVDELVDRLARRGAREQVWIFDCNRSALKDAALSVVTTSGVLDSKLRAASMLRATDGEQVRNNRRDAHRRFEPDLKSREELTIADSGSTAALVAADLDARVAKLAAKPPLLGSRSVGESDVRVDLRSSGVAHLATIDDRPLSPRDLAWARSPDCW